MLYWQQLSKASSPNISADQVQSLVVSAGSRWQRRQIESSSSQSIFASYRMRLWQRPSSLLRQHNQCSFSILSIAVSLFTASIQQDAVLFRAPGFFNGYFDINNDR